MPSWSDPVVALATRAVGGPLGRYAVVGAAGLAGVASALMAMATVTLGLSVWGKGHCLMKGWTTPDQFWRMCYSDLPVVHGSSALARRALPWDGLVPSDQAPLPGLVMWLLARVSPVVGTSLAAQRWIFLLWALLAVLLLAVAVLAAVALHPRRPWQAAHLAASPVVVALAVVSTDLLGVALTLVALWAWRRDRTLVAGALLGLAVLCRPLPLAFAVALVLVALRRGERGAAVRLLLGGCAAAAAVLLPLVLVSPDALQGLRTWGSPGYGALPMVPQLFGHPLPSGTAAWIGITGWLVAVALATWVVWRPGVRPSEVGTTALVLLVVALTTPTLSVQSGLWVLPVLALSARPWSQHLLWAFAEVLHFGATWLHLAFGSNPGRGLPPEAYGIVIVLRLAAWTWILWEVWHEPGRRQAPLRPVARTPRVVPAVGEPRPEAVSAGE